MKNFKAQVMDSAAVNRSIMRISHEIIEKNKGAENLCIVGIKSRGVSIAKQIKENILSIEKSSLPLGVLDINFYRDDVKSSPEVTQPVLPFEVEGKDIILVDDVLYTGRSVRAAIEAIFSLGRPKTIQLAILIDRGHRELPIRADYIGKNIPTARNERVAVCLPDFDGECGVFIQ